MTEVNPHKVVDSVTLKILRELIENPGQNYTKKTLAEAADVGRSSIYFRWDELINLNILKEADVESKHDYYTLDRDSQAAKLFEELLYDIIEVDKNDD